MTKIEKLEDIGLKGYLEEKPKIKCNIYPLDTLLSQGFTYGEIVQLVGETKTGKTTLALQVALGFCRQDKKVLFIDAKGDVTNQRLAKLSLTEYNQKNFFCIKESKFNEVEDILDKLIKNEKLDLIIIDSLPSLINERYIDLKSSKRIKSDNTNTNSGTRPLVFLINKLKKLSMEYEICLLFINEFRNKIEKLRGTLNTPFGPKCLQYESSNIIQVKRITSGMNKNFRDLFSKLEDAKIGISDELISLKSTSLVPPPPLPFFFEHGIGYKEKYLIIHELIKQHKITKSGTYYQFGEIKANGMLEFIQALDNARIFKT